MEPVAICCLGNVPRYLPPLEQAFCCWVTNCINGTNTARDSTYETWSSTKLLFPAWIFLWAGKHSTEFLTHKENDGEVGAALRPQDAVGQQIWRASTFLEPCRRLWFSHGPFCLLRNREAWLRMKLGKEVALEGLLSCYQWFFQHLLNIFSFKAPYLETRGNRICRRCEIYVSIPVTVDDMVASSLDAELLCCNKLLTGKDLLFFGINHNNQHPKGSKLISRFCTLFCNSYPPITATHRQIVPTEPTQTRS